MKVYKDNFITVLVTMLIIIFMGLIGFFIGSFLLSPKTSTSSNKNTYKPKVKYPNGPITLTYWRTIEGVGVFDPILAEYNKLYANVKIEVKDIKILKFE